MGGARYGFQAAFEGLFNSFCEVNEPLFAYASFLKLRDYDEALKSDYGTKIPHSTSWSKKPRRHDIGHIRKNKTKNE